MGCDHKRVNSAQAPLVQAPDRPQGSSGVLLFSGHVGLWPSVLRKGLTGSARRASEGGRRGGEAE